MIQVCYYRGCGVIYGEKEPLSDKTVTHGLCPLHTEVSLRELRFELERLKSKPGRFNVLVVEDNARFRQLLKELLRDRFPSIDIYEAADGNEALEKVEAFHPDLIFMDIRLPGENGLDLTKKIKARYPDVVVIILTGYDLPEYRNASQQCADYFFSKDSATTETIIALVQSLLTETRLLLK
jgi:CheY-like chemotaxis protein